MSILRTKTRYIFLMLAAMCASVSIAWGENPNSLFELPDPLKDAKYDILRRPQSTGSSVATDEHPMLPALRYAYQRYERMQREIHDYSGKLIMRERIRGRLKKREYMEIRVRHRSVSAENEIVPFGVYLHYLAPSKIQGREILFVEGENDGRFIATRGGKGPLRDLTMWLEPDGHRAMRSNHYPLTDVGISNLARRLIEIGTLEMQSEAAKDAKVRFTKGAKINKRPCVMIQVTHPERREGLLYHVARIFVDEETQVPIRYASYSWPPKAGDPPLLMEEYTYVDLKLNVGLKSSEFDHTNSKYRFREPKSIDETDVPALDATEDEAIVSSPQSNEVARSDATLSEE